MTEPSSQAATLNQAYTSLAVNRLRMDALGSLEADNNGVTTIGGGAFVNNSGSTRSVGDLVICDTTANDDFTTTTTVADGRVLGVVIDGSIANGVKGAIQTRGPALVNVTGSVARGDYLVASGTAAMAQSNGPSMRPGVFAVALEANSGGTVIALLYGHCVFGNPQNHLTNGGFEIWQRGSGAFTGSGTYSSDRWFSSLNGTSTLSVSKDTQVNNDLGSNSCAALTYVHNIASNYWQKIENYIEMRGRTISLSMRVKTATASSVRLTISDGVATTVGNFHSGSGVYETLTVTRTIAGGATQVLVGVELDASATIYLDNAMLVISQSAWDFVPLTPHEDLARCLRYYQRFSPSTSNTGIGSGQAGSTTQAYISLPILAEMGGNPSLTVSATSDWSLWLANTTVQAATAISLNGNGAGRSVQLGVQVASGLVAGNATTLVSSNTTAWLALEWNP